MAVIKVFDSKGVKTVVLMGNVNDQEYDTEEVFEEAQEEDDNPF